MSKNNIINNGDGNSNTNNPSTDSISSQQFCVRWNSHLGSLGAAFPQLLAGQRFVDVTLACEGHQLHCHRLVLAACSSYFESLLGENPCKHPIIILPRDIKLWEIQALVDFMYKGEVNVSQAGLSDLLKCADILQIRGLSGTDSSVNLNQVGKESDLHINSQKLPQLQQDQEKQQNNEINNDKLFNQISGNSLTSTISSISFPTPSSSSNSIQLSSLSGISNNINSSTSQILQIPKNNNLDMSSFSSTGTLTKSIQSLNSTDFNKNHLKAKDDLILNQQDQKEQILLNQQSQHSEKFCNQLKKILSENSTLFCQKNSKTLIENTNSNYNNINSSNNINKTNDYSANWKINNNNNNCNDNNVNNNSIDIHLVNSLKKSSCSNNETLNNKKESNATYGIAIQNNKNNTDYNDSNIIKNNIYNEETNNIINNNKNDKEESKTITKINSVEKVENDITTNNNAKDDSKNITSINIDKEENNNNLINDYYDDKDSYNKNSKIDNISNQNIINDDNNNNNSNSNNNNININNNYNNNNNENPMEINYLTENFENYNNNDNNDDHDDDLHEDENRSLENSFNLAVAAVIAAASTSNLNNMKKNNNMLNDESCTDNVEDSIGKNIDNVNRINFNNKSINNTQSLIPKTEPMDTASILEDETDDNSLYYNKIDGDDSDFLDSTIRSSDDVYDYDKNELRISMKNLPVGKKVRRSEAILRQAAECVSKGQTFQTVSDMFNIPISTIRFFMARKGILPRRKRGRSAGCSLIGNFNNNLTNELLSLAVGGGNSTTNTIIENFQKLNALSPVTTASLVTAVATSPSSLSSSMIPSKEMHKLSQKSLITTPAGRILSSSSISTSSSSSSSSSSSLGIENFKDNINTDGTNNIFNYNENKNSLEKSEKSQNEIPFNFINYKLPDIKQKLL